MTFGFWILAIVMMALAVAFLLPALRKKSTHIIDDRREQNITIAKQQLQELEIEHQEGNIEKDAYESAKSELEQTLYDDLEEAKKQPPPKNHEKETRYGLVFTAIFIPLFAIILYNVIGKPEAMAESSVDYKDPRTMTRDEARMSISAMLSKLENKLKKEPNNTEGWIMLGRSYMVMNRDDDAIKAYTKANKLEPDSPNTLLPLADALATIKEGDLKGKPETLVLKALEKEPNNIMALWLAGMAARQRGVNEEALSYWQKLEPMLDPASDDRKEVRTLISQIGGQLTALPTTNQTPASTPKTTNPTKQTGNNNGITVTVSLADELKAKVAPETTVFIYAKALSGPPMPLAVMRKQVKDLPLQLTLDDSMAMMPQLKISSFEAVKIEARVSFSGTPKAQPGDLSSEKQDVKIGDVIELVIASTKPSTKQPADNAKTATPPVPVPNAIPPIEAIPTLAVETATSPAPIVKAAIEPNHEQIQTGSKTGIKVTVSLAETLKTKVTADTTVFIYAKAISGPPMPLAVVRKQVKDLPLQMVLDDSMAMMPQLKISSFEAVKVEARVSLSGTAKAQIGDLFSEKSPVKIGDVVELVIDSIIE